VGTIELAIPKLRQGSSFPEWLFEPRQRSGARTSVVAEAYVLGVATRQVEALVQAMGIRGISKSRVAERAQSVEERVESFRKPWTAGPLPPSGEMR
jgi:putative transposase